MRFKDARLAPRTKLDRLAVGSISKNYTMPWRSKKITSTFRLYQRANANMECVHAAERHRSRPSQPLRRTSLALQLRFGLIVVGQVGSGSTFVLQLPIKVRASFTHLCALQAFGYCFSRKSRSPDPLQYAYILVVPFAKFTGFFLSLIHRPIARMRVGLCLYASSPCPSFSLRVAVTCASPFLAGAGGSTTETSSRGGTGAGHQWKCRGGCR